MLTGDYLAELTMLILWRDRLKDPARGYARTFLRQLRDGLRLAVERDVHVVVNAGGLEPAGLASAVRELARDQGLDVDVAHVEGDDLLDRVPELAEGGHGLANLDTGAAYTTLANPPLTANAYLGGFGIAAALDAGARVVVTGRVTDAALVVGPGRRPLRLAAHHDLDAARRRRRRQGTSSSAAATRPAGTCRRFDELLDAGVDLTHPGFPIAELHRDGSSVHHQAPRHGRSVVDARHRDRTAALRGAGPGVRQPGRGHAAARQHRARPTTARTASALVQCPRPGAAA